MSENIRIVEEFVAAWSSLDATRLAGYFCDDGSYYNLLTQPVTVGKMLKNLSNNFSPTGPRQTGS
jgi:hypothetical protein